MSDAYEPEEPPEPAAALDAIVRQPSKAGRHPSLIPNPETIRLVSALSQLQCTKREAAATLRVHHNTFEKFLAEHEEAKAAWEDGRGIGRMSLRRRQWKHSETNAVMAIFLGKQKEWLGQTDGHELSGPGGGSIPVNFGRLSSAQLNQFLARVDQELAATGEGDGGGGTGEAPAEGD
jgi:hypothetical protein